MLPFAAAATALKIAYLPVLGTLRDVYVQPRDMRRFRNYVATMTGGTDDIVLPIGVANPMPVEIRACVVLADALAWRADPVAALASSSGQPLRWHAARSDASLRAPPPI